MTPREKLVAVLGGEMPDRVPVASDFSNMIPARLTGKPFWDLHLHNGPPMGGCDPAELKRLHWRPVR